MNSAVDLWNVSDNFGEEILSGSEFHTHEI
jgi:hypothetical protein